MKRFAFLPIAAIALPALAQTAPQPGDILVSAFDEDGFANVFIVNRGQVAPEVFPAESVGSLVLSPTLTANDTNGRILALNPATGGLEFYQVADTDVEGGPLYVPAAVGITTDIGGFVAPQLALGDATLAFQNPAAAFRPSVLAFDHPLRGDTIEFEDPLFGFEDPLFGFEDPLFGFEDPLFGFEDPLFGFNANEVTVNYQSNPAGPLSFAFNVTGATMDDAQFYARNWFIDPGEIPAGGTAPLEDRLAGVIALVTTGGTPGLYRAPFTTGAITARTLAMAPYATGGVFDDPSYNFDGMHIDPVIPGGAFVWGSDGAARGLTQPVIVRINPDLSQSVLTAGGSITSIDDLIVAPDGTIYVMDAQANGGFGRIIAVNPTTGAQSIIRDNNGDFLNLQSIAFVGPEPQVFSFLDFTDGGSNSLRQAITEANAEPTRVADIYLEAGVYQLNIPGTAEDGNATGDLDVTSHIRIKGQGEGVTIIDGNDIERVFDVLPTGTLVLENLTVRNGSVLVPSFDGGGGNIRVTGRMSMVRVEVADGLSNDFGGGNIWLGDSAQLNAYGCTIRDGRSRVGAGGINATDSSTSTIDRCVFRGNNSTGTNSNGRGSGLNVRELASATVTRSSFVQNFSEFFGSAVDINTAGTVVFADCIVANNSFNTSGETTPPLSVAGMATFLSETTIRNSVFWGNTNGGSPTDLITRGFTTPTTFEAQNFAGTMSTDAVIGSLPITGGNPWLQTVVNSTGQVLGYKPRRWSRLVDAGPLVTTETDMLGLPREVDGNGDGTPRADIGAIEGTDNPCLADTNGDGLATPADFNGWIIGYNFGQAQADQNRDGFITPADFNAWIINFNAGCP